VVLVNKEHKTERVLQRVAIEPADQRQTLLCPSDQTQWGLIAYTCPAACTVPSRKRPQQIALALAPPAAARKGRTTL